MGAPDLAVLGGLGPRASAEFVRTIYELGAHAREQEAPFVVLSSDPTYPDRTDVLLKGNEAPLLDRLRADLQWFAALGAARTVICCVTMHHLVPRLSHDLQERLVSLVTTALDEVVATRMRALLLCSTGTRKLDVFGRHPGWRAARQFVVLPSDADQATVHELLYRIKGNAPVEPMFWEIQRLLARYRVSSFVAGCTELHVLVREAVRQGVANDGWGYVDPLTTIARAAALGAVKVPCNG